MIHIGIKSVMVTRDETTTLDLGRMAPHPHMNMKYWYCNRLYHLDFNTINTYLQLFNFSKSINIYQQ